LIISESGLDFGPFQDSDLFHVEKSELYKKFKNKPKVAEFLVLHSTKTNQLLWIFEARTSNPKSSNSEDYLNYESEILEKWRNTFDIFVSVRIGRNSDDNGEVGKNLIQSKLSSVRFVFLLVITNAKADWLIPISNSIKTKLFAFCKIYNIFPEHIIVLSGDEVKKTGLVI
jgi:hypothetical protein